jgi:hypothetical protein
MANLKRNWLQNVRVAARHICQFAPLVGIYSVALKTCSPTQGTLSGWLKDSLSVLGACIQGAIILIALVSFIMGSIAGFRYMKLRLVVSQRVLDGR